MQTRIFRRVARAAALPAMLTLLAGCSGANDPYAKLGGAPLIEARLHTVTLLSDDDTLAGRLQGAGYRPMDLPPNYPAADQVLGVLWDVPAEVAKDARVLAAPGKGPNLRCLAGPLPPAKPRADAALERSFFRNVLGTDVPALPANVTLDAHTRVQAWTYQVASIVDARRKLRAHAIPAVTEPVAITTPYFGDQKSMSLRAPDGAIVELVEAAAK